MIGTVLLFVISFSFEVNAACKYNEYLQTSSNNCVKCENTMYGCAKCSINSSSELQCDECKYGLILTPEPFNHCIDDCTQISTHYVNNRFTGACEDCGMHCTKCNLLTGCTDSPMLNKGYKLAVTGSHMSSLFKELTKCTDSRCLKCSTTDTTSQCDQCYSSVSTFIPCDLCANTDSNCLQCDSTNTSACKICKEGYSLNPDTNICTACTATNCKSCTISKVTIDNGKTCVWTADTSSTNGSCGATGGTGGSSGGTGGTSGGTGGRRLQVTDTLAGTTCDLSQENQVDPTTCDICTCTANPPTYEYPQTCDTCVDKYVMVSGTCTSCNPSALAWDETSCLFCDSTITCLTCEDGYFLSASSNKCKKACPSGTYPQITVSSEGVISSKVCTTCPSGCLTCNGADSTQNCLSCDSNKILSITDTINYSGKCISKDTTTLSLDIFVSNDASWISSGTEPDGTLSKPFYDLEDAINYGMDKASSQKLTQIQIYLWKGTHYLLYSPSWFYQNKYYRNDNNVDVQISITPLYCTYSNTGGVSITSFCVSSGTKVTVMNKRGERFILSSIVTLTDVIFDSIDSLLSSSDGVSLACLNTRIACCKVNDAGTDITNSTISSATLCKSRLVSDEKCTLSSYRSFIKLKVSSTQQFTTPNTISISNCEFNNFFYDINSIVSPNQYGSIISISSSKFSRVSNCGGIIKNFNNYPLSAGTAVTDPTTDKNAYFNYISLTAVIKAASIYHATDMTSNPFSSSCSSSSCFSLSVQSSTFSYLGFLKTLMTGMNVVPNSYNYRYQAMAINLYGFGGSITLNFNTFSNNYVMIDGCSQVQSLASVPTVNTYITYLSTSGTIYQIKSIISIMSHPYLLVIGENTFTSNVGVKGVVMLESTMQKQYPIFIIGNTFTKNSGFLYSDALYIRKITTNIYNPSLTDTTHYCSNIYMASNSFTNNIGCAATTEGTVKVYCYSTNTPGSSDYYTNSIYLDHQSLVSNTPSSTDQTSFISLSPSSFTTKQYTLTYGGTYGTITFNMQKALFTSNTFTSNYGGYKGAIISIEGFPYFDFTSSVFSSNGNNIPDFMQLYSPIVNNVQSSNTVSGQFKSLTLTDTVLSSYTYKMKAILNIEISNTMTFSSLSFTNNWVIGAGASFTVSHSILIANCYKSFTCTDCIFTQNKGISNDPILTSAINLVDFSSITKGMTKPLINFERYFWTTFSISGTSQFTYNLMVENGDGNGYLFKVGQLGSLQSVNSIYTTMSITATFQYNIIKNANALFFPYVKTFTCTSCVFQYNGYDTSSPCTSLMNYLLYLQILDGCSFTFQTCTFSNNNIVSNPIFVIDQSSISYSGTPSSVNFKIDTGIFSNNIVSTNNRCLKIMNNPWIYGQISNSVFQASLATPFTSCTSAYLCQSQNIGNVYKMKFSSITYSSVSLTTTAGATASIHQKNYPYIMEFDTITVQCTTLTSSDTLKSQLSSNTYTNFNRPSIFVISSTGTSSFKSITVSGCTGMKDGGIYKISSGSITDTSSSYSGLIVYQGGVYSLDSGTSVTASNVSLINSYTYQGGVAYSSSVSTLSISTGTISSVTMYSKSLYYFSGGATVSLNAVSMSSITADSSTIFICLSSCTFTMSGGCSVTNSIATNGNLLFYAISSTITISSATITSNSAKENFAQAITSSTITITSLTFSSNTVTLSCGGFCISDSTSLTISQSTFSSNTMGQRAIISSQQNCVMTFSNVQFSQNSASQDSSVLYVSDATSITFTSCSFTKNKSFGGGNTLSFIFSDSVTFTSCTFTANKAIKESNHIYSIFTTMTVSGCTFDDSDSSMASSDLITGGFMYLSTGSTITITGSTYKNGQAIYGGAVYILGNANVSIKSSTFTNNQANQGGAIHATSYNSFSISDSCSFSGNSASSKVGECIYVTNAFSPLTISSSSFSVSVNAIYIERTDISVSSCTFTGTTTTVDPLSLYAGGIELSEVETGTFSSSTFTSLVGLGGALKITSNAYFKQQSSKVSYTITDSTIQNCLSSEHGGGIYVDTIRSLTLTNTKVTGNKASSGEGGGIYFICLHNPADQCFLNLINTNVTLNSAKIGGGIKWDYREPSADSNSNVINNVATLYGTDYACFAREIKEIKENEYTYYTTSTNDLSATSNGSKGASITSLNFSGVMSGGSIPTTYLALVDQYNQVVTSSNSDSIEFLVDTSSTIQTQFQSQVYGQTKFYSVNGVYNVTGLYLIADPNSNQKLLLRAYGIDVSIPVVRTFLYELLGVDLTTVYELPMGIGLRPCLSGEGLRESGACYTCPKGTYLLVVPTTPTDCLTCNTERSICLGGAQIGPKPGYWRNSNTTDVFQVCYKSSACLGMTAPTYNPKGDCDTGYYGTLCQGCLPGYTRSGNDGCAACPNTILNLLKTSGIFIACIIGIAIMVRSLIKSALKSSPTSIYLKILFNHIQLMSITSSFNFQWPSSIVSFFSYVTPISNASDNLISTDCLFDFRSKSSVDITANTAPSSEIRTQQINLITYWILPWVVAFFVIVTFAVILKLYKKMIDLNSRFVTTYIFIIFMVFPSITQKMVDQFNCQYYNNEYRLRKDLQVYCYVGYQLYFTLGVALPGLLIYSIGIPAGVLYLMRLDKDKLETINVKQKFGFLINGYKRKFFYWEIILMYRKVLMIFISVFLNGIGLIVQALVMLIVLVIFIQINNLKRPFADRALNEIENFSLMTATVTIYCGIFFLSAKDPTSQSFDKNRDFALNDYYIMILFLCIVGSNLVFGVVWCVKFYFIFREMIREKYPKLYIYFFLCCRKDKWARENVQRAKNEKNEYMIAKIEDVQYFMKDMKSLYIGRINYEGHEEFMKLLYIIEDMQPKIDLTIKKNEFKIDGKIARERRFDPEHLKNALDDKKLDVNESFDSKGSQSGSGSMSKKNKNSKFAFQIEQPKEKYIFKDEHDLLKYIGTRKNVQKINNEYFEINEQLRNDKYDFSLFKNEVEEHKMHKLEKHFKKRLVDTTEKSKGNIGLQSVNVSEKDKSSKIFVTQQPANTSLADFENTSSNLLVKDYQDFEDELQLHDNDMSKIKMSRNAKILMTRSKDQVTGVDRSYKINPVYNLPPGEEIRNDEMNVEDFDEDDNSILKILKSKKGAMNKIASVFGKKKAKITKDDSNIFNKKDHRLISENDDNNKHSFITTKSNHEVKHNQDEEGKLHLGINKEESHESISVSNRSSSRREQNRRDSKSKYDKTFDKMKQQLGKARHKIEERVQKRIEMFHELENAACENLKRKPKEKSKNSQINIKRKSFVPIEEIENDDYTIENKDLEVNFDECLESID